MLVFVVNFRFLVKHHGPLFQHFVFLGGFCIYFKGVLYILYILTSVFLQRVADQSYRVRGVSYGNSNFIGVKNPQLRSSLNISFP